MWIFHCVGGVHAPSPCYSRVNCTIQLLIELYFKMNFVYILIWFIFLVMFCCRSKAGTRYLASRSKGEKLLWCFSNFLYVLWPVMLEVLWAHSFWWSREIIFMIYFSPIDMCTLLKESSLLFLSVIKWKSLFEVTLITFWNHWYISFWYYSIVYENNLVMKFKYAKIFNYFLSLAYSEYKSSYSYLFYNQILICYFIYKCYLIIPWNFWLISSQ